eukprot:NODE_12023_length_420_cov_14.676768_g11365_i0.p1 GENE.NODE_12023_length_420_cov_14.676768_g11365_i0~~NODE_12023_length_420_cov_14.676768_g11365_i0.p1  ORF type:complete len:109 (-),score=29.43 NODE_12023_length_420_cov_14.676768_g11365_i0:46-372(-)
MKYLLLVCILLVVVIAQGQYGAPQPGESLEDDFQVLDADGNGFLSKDEFAVMLQVALAGEDGQGGEGQAPEGLDEMLNNAMQDLDTNKDGKISPQEFNALNQGPLNKH